MIISDERKLWLFIAVNCMKFSNPMDSKKHAEMVVGSLRNREEAEYVMEMAGMK